MATYREYAVFPGIVLLVIGAIACQMTGADAVSLPSDPPAVVKTLAPLQSASGLTAPTGIDPI
jgi:hypothetical protein